MKVDRAWFDERFSELGLKQGEVADRMDRPRSRLNELLQGRRRHFDPAELDALARVLNVPVAVVLEKLGVESGNSPSRIPINYHIDREDRVLRLHPSVVGDIEYIRLHGIQFAGVLGRIQTTTWEPRFRRGEIIGWTFDGRDPNSLLGREVVVELPSGEIYLKKIWRGSSPGRYTLASLGEETPPMVDVEIRRCGAITLHLLQDDINSG